MSDTLSARLRALAERRASKAMAMRTRGWLVLAGKLDAEALDLRAAAEALDACSPMSNAPAMPNSADADAGLIASLEAASRDDRLSTGMLYRQAAARLTALREERDRLAHDITEADANELQDALHTLTNSGPALLTSARELVRRMEKAEAARDAAQAELHTIQPSCGHEQRYLEPGQWGECQKCAVEEARKDRDAARAECAELRELNSKLSVQLDKRAGGRDALTQEMYRQIEAKSALLKRCLAYVEWMQEDGNGWERMATEALLADLRREEGR